MLKDVVVNLSGRGPRDFAADYATSIAAAFGARIAGVSFLYEPVIPDGTLGGIPVDLIELQREENSKIAKDAVSRFEAGRKRREFRRKRVSSTRRSGAPPRCSPRSRAASISPWSVRRSARAERPMRCWSKGRCSSPGVPLSSCPISRSAA